jgi:glycosyltransferase involved in cell wall biosynthesis
VKTGRDALSIVQVNYVFDKELKDPVDLLDRYATLTGWSEALVAAGAGAVTAVQRFHHDARITRNGVRYVFTRARGWRFAREIASARGDLVHVHGTIFPARTRLLRIALPASAALVVQNHSDGGAVGRAPLFRLRGRLNRGIVDGYLFAATEHAAAWRDAGFIAAAQPIYQVMESSTSLRPIARDAARHTTGMLGDPAVLWVGRLNANKDPLTVLAGFEQALAALPDATLTMVYGGADLVDEVRRRVNGSARLRDRVRLAGAVRHEEMPSFFSAADLYVGGSHHEGSGYALIEACACSVVPVVTDIPTFRLLAGGAGALWPPGDAGACARALVDVARRDLGAERTRLSAHFTRELTWTAIGRRALAIYQEVVARRATRPRA